MKKWFLLTAFILIATFAGLYLYIPVNLDIVQITPVNCTIFGAYRNLATSNAWQQWWFKDNPPLTLRNNRYHISKTLLNTIEIAIQQQDVRVSSTMHLLPLSGDSVAIEWKCNFMASTNPFTRLKHYRQAIALKNNMAAVLSRFSAFARRKENVYGISIHDTATPTTQLIATKMVVPTYPAQADMYKLIHALQAYSGRQQAQATGYPIINITQLEKGGFQLMAGLPINKSIPEKAPFFNSTVPADRFLITQVTGGDSTVKQAYNQLQLYIQDYRRIVMALPFQQLITDRRAEPDSAKWVTIIYFPVMPV